MKPAEGLHYLFLDLNSYFASVEQQVNPALRGKPVAVVPMDTESTCAIAASYEAKAFGVKTGTKIYHAKRICPQLKLVPARHEIYTEYHYRIMEEIERHVPIEKVHSIDEAACRLLDNERSVEAACDLARRIKAGLANNKKIGPYIRCSIGIAPNRFLAKLATDLQKPDGLVVLRQEDLPGRIAHLSLKDLPGINTRMERRLLRANIATVQKFWHSDPKHMRQIWGGVQGERFWYALRGYEIPEIKTQKRVVGHSRVLAPEYRPQPQARLIARALLLKAAKRLRLYELTAQTLYLSLRVGKTQRFKAEARFAPTGDSFLLLCELEKLWRGYIRAHGPRVSARKVSVSLTRLGAAGVQQFGLPLTTTPAKQKQNERKADLWQRLDHLNKRYGKETITLASQMPVSAQYLGLKIAFTRIPEREEYE